MKKLALKYGLIITVAVMAWVIIAHLLVPNPQSLVLRFGTPAFFNIVQFVCIYLGVAEFRRQLGERATFKQLLKLGVWISFVYAVGASLFFVGVLIVVGTKWMAGEPGAQQLPITLLAIQAFTGLFLGTMLFGLLYSTLIAFVMAKRLTRSA
ncbi:MAG TPA: DUF4199 family protein [Pyrinomonadaceae bacterium]|jgi:uncharacterized membrane protein